MRADIIYELVYNMHVWYLLDYTCSIILPSGYHTIICCILLNMHTTSSYNSTQYAHLKNYNCYDV